MSEIPGVYNDPERGNERLNKAWVLMEYARRVFDMHQVEYQPFEGLNTFRLIELSPDEIALTAGVLRRYGLGEPGEVSFYMDSIVASAGGEDELYPGSENLIVSLGYPYSAIDICVTHREWEAPLDLVIDVVKGVNEPEIQTDDSELWRQFQAKLDEGEYIVKEDELDGLITLTRMLSGGR